MKYYIVVQLPAYSISPERFAVESAFGVHLRLLKKVIGPAFEELVLIAPYFDKKPSDESFGRLELLDVRESGVRFLPAFSVSASRAGFLLKSLWPTWTWLRRLFSEPCVVHSGISSELSRPLMLMSCLAARSQRRSVMFFVDMDYRQHSWQLYRAGHWTLRSYLLNRFLYDPMLTLQLRLAPKLFDVCCFKSESLVRDFGGGRHNVRSFFDTVHSAADVVNGTARETRVAWLRQTTTSFKVVYFGRLVFNKGIDKMIAAVDMARARGVDVCMRIIGSGDRLDSLVEQIQVLGLARHVQLFDAVQYGEKLFSLLEDCHVSLAAPLIEDTPRSAFDSFSRGLPIVAFDTGYFTDLAQKSGAVLTSPWSSVEGLAEAMVKLARNRELLCQMCENAIKFATDNTQEIWLRRRMDWLTEVTPELRTALSAPQ